MPRCLLLVPLALLACATPMEVDAERDASFDFGGLRTWSWSGGEAPGAAAVRDLRAEDVERWVRTAVEARLAEAGYAEQPEGADFAVRYEVTVATRRRQEQVVRDAAGVSHSASVSYPEGTLVLEAIPRAGGAPVFRGWAAAELQRYGTLEDREARVREAVERILRRFPQR